MIQFQYDVTQVFQQFSGSWFVVFPVFIIIAFITIVFMRGIIGGGSSTYDEQSYAGESVKDFEIRQANKTQDKVTKVSMDNYKTKEDHPLGDKTHD